MFLYAVGACWKNMEAFYGKRKNVTIYSCIFLMSSGGRQFIVTCKICQNWKKNILTFLYDIYRDLYNYRLCCQNVIPNCIICWNGLFYLTHVAIVRILIIIANYIKGVFYLHMTLGHFFFIYKCIIVCIWISASNTYIYIK